MKRHFCVGTKVICFYILFGIFFPVLLTCFNFDYDYFFSTNIKVIFIFLLSVFAAILGSLFLRQTKCGYNFIFKLKNKYILLFSFLFFAVGIYANTLGYTNYRYGQSSLMERYDNFPIGLVFFALLNPLALIFPFLILIFCKNLFFNKDKLAFYLKLAVFAASFVNINGLASGILVLFYALCYFFRRPREYLLYKKSFSLKLSLTSFLKFCFFLIFAACISYISFKAKFLDTEKMENMVSYFKSDYILKRFSVTGQVTLGLIYLNFEKVNSSFFNENRRIPFDLLKSRFQRIFSQKSIPSETKPLSLSRQVVEFLSPYSKEMPRMGTSPGLIGTAFLVLPWYFAIPLLFFMSIFFSIFFQWLFLPINCSHNAFLIVVSLSLSRIFFDSFYDLFSLLRPEVFSVLFVVFLRLFCKPTKSPEAKTS